MSKHICTRWAFDLASWKPTLSQLSQAVALIQPEERVRLMKFHFIDDFLSSLIGRLLMRKYVSTCSGLELHQVKFARDVRGKPYWVREDINGPPLSFNASHQGNMVLLAGIIGEANDPDFGIGADVMKIEYSGGKSLAEFFRLMNRKFSAQEWKHICRVEHNEREQVKAFMRHWCLKEAYVKELGVGITVDLEKISFSVDTTHPLEEKVTPLVGTSLRCHDKPMDNWHFEEHLLQEEYCAAIAFRNCLPPDHGRFKFLRIEELLVTSPESELEEVQSYCRKALLKPYKRSQKNKE
ncbi:L-aminoadipate-semialdehyde dehydrogenase-phosphopantetheinyl transferase [Drosophila ficusphila]|uniref:L-aminoadipate-semialdehyde dehydrogenase-phosphopantetheinyl transferase n=1 Tax=Drosophila ficusphila TaxID=30025 RepID=UPI0007E7F833|nr:L-aminoadipate-semialdehyde dehydrogenase-phosphopantetheinyl transferase [Drosophila ficusphila]